MKFTHIAEVFDQMITLVEEPTDQLFSAVMLHDLFSLRSGFVYNESIKFLKNLQKTNFSVKNSHQNFAALKRCYKQSNIRFFVEVLDKLPHQECSRSRSDTRHIIPARGDLITLLSMIFTSVPTYVKSLNTPNPAVKAYMFWTTADGVVFLNDCTFNLEGVKYSKCQSIKQTRTRKKLRYCVNESIVNQVIQKMKLTGSFGSNERRNNFRCI